MIIPHIFSPILSELSFFVGLFQPSLVGKAVLPLKQLLAAKSPSNGHFQLKIKSSTLAEAVKERETDDAVVGSLEVYTSRTAIILCLFDSM